ncbi:MAG TPA: histone deacetylase family protein [Alphaproteobacteria bacterium]|jgi:acetoin utilization deacetylase AcuC-like enzyme
MTTALYSHPACLAHDPGPHHPESPDRLAAVLRALEAPEFAALVRREAPLATEAQVARVHPPEFVRRMLAAVPRDGFAMVDGDTILSPGSGEAALRAAGALCAAVDAVMAGEVANAFCAVRPPGHHAEPGESMGFCLFNNVAVGALHARHAHGLQRIAVVDFDVHHGNGTQAAFEADANLFFASSHQSPLYPGTGAASERGVGNVWNAPLRPGSGSADFRKAWSETLLPALRAFDPQFILISAGFDAHADDPLANLNLTDDDYAWITREIVGIANDRCSGRVVSTLEGGYDLNALARSVTAHVSAIQGIHQKE